MSKELGELAINQIVKNDSVYNNALKTRISRLEMYKSELLSTGLGKEVNKSINLTKECHQIAENLKTACIRLVKLFPADTETALDQLIATQIKAGANSKEFKGISKEALRSALVGQQDDFKIAKQILLETISGKDKKTKNDDTMLNVVDRILPEDGTYKRVFLRMNTGILATQYKSYMSAISVIAEFIKLTEMCKGLFYMGIVDYHGSELDEKELKKHLVDFAKETAGVFLPPVVSNVISLINMLNRLVDVIMDLHNAEVPEIIQEAKKLELFLRKYQSSLKAWKSAAKITLKQLHDYEKVIKQFQQAQLQSA